MFKKILFQIHWFVGITAGTLLMLVGITGAMLSFSDEMIEALNPGAMAVARQPAAALDAQQLITRIQTAYPDRPVLAVTLAESAAGSAQVHAVRINFVAPPGERRGELRYADPYNGQLLPPLRAEPFFKWVEYLHRFLLLPTPTGKLIMGSAAMCLLFLALSGLYLRWPRHALQWRAWFRLDFSLQGRSFLWHLHSMLGTWALLMYLVFTVTGMYWSFDWVKNGLDRLAGETPAVKMAKEKKAGAAPSAKSRPPVREVLQADQLARVWTGFTAAVPAYRSVTLRLPERASEPVQITYLDTDAPHELARNRMRIDTTTGAISDHLRYNDKSATGRLVSSFYPLHIGTYFGLPGRIVMMAAALGLPLFGVTGWMLYLDRRRKKRAIARERVAMNATSGVPNTAAAQTGDSVLIVFATQSGYAEQIALRSAAALQAAGLAVSVRSIAGLGLEQLCHYRQALFVVSSFGEGEPPDSARGFTRQLMHQPGATLAHLQYGVLALGDRHYRNFCGYGHTLDHHLQSQGAHSRFAMVEVDNADPAALALWQRSLAGFFGIAGIGIAAEIAAPAKPACYENWQLAERRHLNPGSKGQPIFHLALTLPGPAAQWRSGALVEILPRHAPPRIAAFLQQTGMDGAASVKFDGRQCTLADALARAILPAHGMQSPSPQSLADTLKILTPRRYSAASIAADRTLQLLVRQSAHEDGLGLASGWLTAHAALGGAIECRLLDNPGFALDEQDAPCIFIGNGSGLAGLRSHLRARVHNNRGRGRGRRRNWLLFGERNRAHDFHYGEEIAQWQRDGFLARVDLAFSRDQAERIYVQDKLREASALVREWIADDAVVYVCGSMDGMAAGVDAALNDILGEDGVEALIAANRYRRDVY